MTGDTTAQGLGNRLVIFSAKRRVTPSVADANGSRSGHSRGHASHSTTHSASSHSAHSAHVPRASSHTKATGVPRDSKGRIERSRTARNDFQKSHPCPSTGKGSGACPGYVVDHVTPLKRGGADNLVTCSGRLQRRRRLRISTNKLNPQKKVTNLISPYTIR